MSRKLFISFLGASNYGACQYAKDEYCSDEVRFVQEATIEYLDSVCHWTSNDAAIFLLTDGARKNNWVDGGLKDREGKPHQGLKTRLEQLNLPLQIIPVTGIPDGNNEKEIMEIFSKTFQLIKEDDELYFDLTHGFRYLPMLTLVLGNYAKFLKHAVVKSITYGNYEGRDRETNTAQLVDLLQLSEIQDWTFAAANFLENGYVSSLASLTEKNYRSTLKETQGQDVNARNLREFTDSLKDVVNDFQTCRGLDIIGSKHIAKMKVALKKLEKTEIETLNPVISKIQDSIQSFDTNTNVANGFYAAKWCLSNGLYQQAATILQENVVSFFALRHGISVDDENRRHLVNSAIEIKYSSRPKEEWKVSDSEKVTIGEIIGDDYMDNTDIINAFHNLTEVRNDLNHSGMRSIRKPLSAKSIRTNIEKCLNLFEILFTHAD